MQCYQSWMNKCEIQLHANQLARHISHTHTHTHTQMDSKDRMDTLTWPLFCPTKSTNTTLQYNCVSCYESSSTTHTQLIASAAQFYCPTSFTTCDCSTQWILEKQPNSYITHTHTHTHCLHNRTKAGTSPNNTTYIFPTKLWCLTYNNSLE